jgi:hypothetical protein
MQKAGPMESLSYFLLYFAGLVVTSWLLLSALVFALGMLLFVRRVRKQRTVVHWSAALAVAMMILSGFLLVTLGSCTVRSICSMRRNLWRASQPSLCLDLPLTEDYQLSVFQQADRAWGYLETVDGDQTLVPHIKEYAIEGYMMVGKDPFYWFWVDLSTGELEQGLTEAEYRAALKRLGFAEEPTLLLVEDLCQIQNCFPCPTVTPNFEGR